MGSATEEIDLEQAKLLLKRYHTLCSSYNYRCIHECSECHHFFDYEITGGYGCPYVTGPNTPIATTIKRRIYYDCESLFCGDCFNDGKKSATIIKDNIGLKIYLCEYCQENEIDMIHRALAKITKGEEDEEDEED